MGEPKPNSEMHRQVVAAVQQLCGSERGRDVLTDLSRFLHGGFAGADGSNVQACGMLLAATQRGFYSLVLDVMDEAIAVHA